ncbi:molybdopterin-guanine dinucleotide biosynthesis protein B [Ectobacillus funiculus]|uniref:molybdopterin-guanine dinucleotide biosynthesis protein B n=1 Tax=Ectobacillus funiculus TaxID=137993 RepID=UPI00101DFDD2|nr:molybdopterin-guanine dinucleotide biosynthesis protein B [Ectobacillus funiculus]
MEVRPVILQIAGYQNSGKTTVAEQIISSLTKEGLRVASFKHHGHGGKPALPEGKDSTRHMHAGSLAAAVEGDGTFAITIQDEQFQLEQWIELCHSINIDVLLIEGYKEKPYEKIVCIRSEEDRKLLRLSNVIAVVSWIPIESDFPVFSVQEEELYCAWMSGYLRRKRHV